MSPIISSGRVGNNQNLTRVDDNNNNNNNNRHNINTNINMHNYLNKDLTTIEPQPPQMTRVAICTSSTAKSLTAINDTHIHAFTGQTFDVITDDILAIIFHMLSPSDILTVSYVSKRWRRVSMQVSAPQRACLYRRRTIRSPSFVQTVPSSWPALSSAAGDSATAVFTSTAASFLPPELLTMIFGYLPLSALCTLQAVCKSWAAVAAPRRRYFFLTLVVDGTTPLHFIRMPKLQYAVETTTTFTMGQQSSQSNNDIHGDHNSSDGKLMAFKKAKRVPRTVDVFRLCGYPPGVDPVLTMRCAKSMTLAWQVVRRDLAWVTGSNHLFGVEFTLDLYAVAPLLYATRTFGMADLPMSQRHSISSRDRLRRLEALLWRCDQYLNNHGAIDPHSFQPFGIQQSGNDVMMNITPWLRLAMDHLDAQNQRMRSDGASGVCRVPGKPVTRKGGRYSRMRERDGFKSQDPVTVESLSADTLTESLPVATRTNLRLYLMCPTRQLHEFVTRLFWNHAERPQEDVDMWRMVTKVVQRLQIFEKMGKMHRAQRRVAQLASAFGRLDYGSHYLMLTSQDDSGHDIDLGDTLHTGGMTFRLTPYVSNLFMSSSSSSVNGGGDGAAGGGYMTATTTPTTTTTPLAHYERLYRQVTSDENSESPWLWLPQVVLRNGDIFVKMRLLHQHLLSIVQH